MYHRRRLQRIAGNLAANLAGLITVEGAEAGARVVHLAVRRRALADAIERLLVKLQTFVLCLEGHPRERHPRQAVIGIAATDIGMHTGKPHLLEAAVVFFVIPEEWRE